MLKSIETTSQNRPCNVGARFTRAILEITGTSAAKCL